MTARPLRIAMIGTRGVPARYGGFETAVEEVGRRLADRGHEVTVYCRTANGVERPRRVQGMRCVYLPQVRQQALETLSHTGLSVAHAIWRGGYDAVLVFNAANSVFLPLLRLRRLPVATHVDGLEWLRGKWGPAGQRYYRAAEALAVRWSDQLIADAAGIAQYYEEEFGAGTALIAYGAPVQDAPGTDKLAELDLAPDSYHLIVARFEPENHVDLILRGYLRSSSRLPLVVVGSAPYSEGHVGEIRRLAESDERVRLVGAVWDQELLDQLYANARTYLHGHSVGGTNPSLLRAMGAGAPVVAWDVVFNREVLGEDGRFFADEESVATELAAAEDPSASSHGRGDRLRERARARYDWDDVARRYEDLCRELAQGRSQRKKHSGRRSGASFVRR